MKSCKFDNQKIEFLHYKIVFIKRTTLTSWNKI